MKRFFVLFCLSIVLFCGCKENRAERKAAEYAGQYHGEFSTTRSEENVSLDTIVDFEVMQSATTPSNLLLQNIIELEWSKEGYFYDAAVTSSQVSQLLSLCGLLEGYFLANVDALKVEAHFYTATLTLDIRYLSEGEFVGHTTFSGSKR
jgi:hypothetical protein